MDTQKIETRLFTFIIAFTLISLCIVPFVPTAKADATYIAFYEPTSGLYYNHHLYMEHPSSSNYLSAEAQSFEATNTGYVTYVTLDLKTVGSPIGNLSMKICNTWNNSGRMVVNETSVIETSTTVYPIEDISNTHALYSFTFSGTNELSVGSHYAIVIYITDNTYMSSTNYVVWAETITDNYDGYSTVYYTAGWTDGDNTYDNYFSVFGETELPDPSATPTPAPSTTPSVPTELTDIWATVGSLIQLIVPLMVVVLPAFFGYKFAGAWGFLAGINIGAILAYVILGAATFPLWGIVVILILDALLLFGKVGFHS